MSKIIGIDYGEKRIGLAISDEAGKYAFPYATFENDKEGVLAPIRELCAKEQVTAIVIGLPLNQDGQPGPAAKKVQDFAEQLQENLHVEIFFEDERFSTTLASSLLRAAGKNTKEIRSRVDRDSARIILQTFLDKKNNG